MFSTNYPAFAALLNLVAGLAKNLAVQNGSLVQKLESEASEVPALVAFLPLASQLGAEVQQLKSSPADIVGGVELLVSDLGFSSTKAQAVINAAFPLAQSIVGLVPQVQALVSAIG